ncbi:MAG: T9SS type A sorting domain-containing protein, partial [Elusimicrobiota bacterium]|nr:T9SS type A sorting domain-containing protein [Elusimicrobiota bacterium]
CPNFSSSTTVTGLKSSSHTITHGLTENATHWWFVVAHDSGTPFGYQVLSTSSSLWWFQVNGENSPPNPFSLVSPASGTIVFISTPTLSWEQATDPDPGDSIAFYRLAYSSFVTDSVPYDGIGKIYSNSISTGPLVENATYWWRVQAWDDANKKGFDQLSSTTTVWYFIVNATSEPPSGFELYSPIDSTNPPSCNWIFFDWEDAIDPDPFDSVDYYKLYFSTDSSFAVSVTTTTTKLYCSSTTVYFNFLLDTTYYWNVQAYGKNEQYAPQIYGLAKSTAEFRITKQPPNNFALYAPSGTIKTSIVNFDWEDVTDPDSYDSISYYQLYYSTNQDFVSISTFGPISSSSYTLTLLPRNTYYWNVRAYDTTGLWAVACASPTWNTYSSTWSFYIQNTPPNSFDIISPTGSIIVSTNYPTFYWQANHDKDENTVTYTLIYSTCSDFSIWKDSTGWSTTYSDTPSTVSAISPTELQENATYWWKVEASDGYEKIISISTGVFRVDGTPERPLPFELISSSWVIITKIPTLKWNSTTDPDPDDYIDYYNVFYASGPGYSLIFSSQVKTTQYTTPELIENAQYRWWVEAYSKISLSRTSNSTWSFIVDAVNDPPDEFNLISPMNNSTTTWTVQFTWQEANRTEFWEEHTYNLYYGKVGIAGEAVISSITTTYYTINFTPEAENSTIWWKVEAVDTKPNKKFSNQTYYIYVSSTNDPPQFPSDISSRVTPADGSLVTTRTPTFSWPAAADPDEPAGDRVVSYTLIYSTVPNILSNAITKSGITTTSFSIQPNERLIQNTTYYWKVEAYDTANNNTSTGIFKFFVGNLNILKPPEYFTKTKLRSDGAEFYIEWSTVTKYTDDTDADDLSGYNIYRGNSPTENFQLKASTNRTYWTDTIEKGKTYYYFIRAISVTGVESANSQIVTSKPVPEIIATTTEKDAYVSISQSEYKKLQSEKRKFEIVKQQDVYELKVLDAQGNQIDYKFTQPVVLNFVVSDLSPQYAVLYYNNVEYVNIGGERDPANKRIYVSVSRTGKYKITAVGERTTVWTVPTKIFTPDGKGPENTEIMKFYYPHTGEQVTGEIYNLHGAVVKKLPASKNLNGWHLEWDGKDDTETPAPKGIYIYQIKVGEKVYTGTIIVAR